MTEIDTLEAFESWMSAPTRAAIQGLDLRGFTEPLCGLRASGSLFLACQLEPRAAGSLVQHGSIVVPDLPGREFTVHRARLYRAEELFDRFEPDRPESFHDCLDQRIYRQYLADGKDRPADISVGMAQGLHDHSISDALYEVLEGQRVVAVMGGHSMERTDPRYRTVVEVSKALAERGYLMVSGGGPGAMEATHVGVWMAGRPMSDVDALLSGPFVRRPPSARPGKEYADPDWLSRAMAAREAWPVVQDRVSVGIPTWLYGHEPPTPFASHIAKYFANSIREDGVLAVATHGVVFAPGSAGTTQEIFQDACQNHYGTMGLISPMILLDRTYWTTVRPVWPLLSKVAGDQTYGELLCLVDDGDAVVRAVQSFEPDWYGVHSDPHANLLTGLRRSLRLRANWSFRVEIGEARDDGSDAETLAHWLFSVGGEDWIDLARARSFWSSALEDGVMASVFGPQPAGLTSRALSVTIDGRTEVWRARLDD